MSDKNNTRNVPLGSTAVSQAMQELRNSDEDMLAAKTKQVYSKVAPPNDNSQLNRLLYPPYTDMSKEDA